MSQDLVQYLPGGPGDVLILTVLLKKNVGRVRREIESRIEQFPGRAAEPYPIAFSLILIQRTLPMR